MEYADGGTLRNFLKEKFANLTWKIKFNLALQISNAVSFLHDKGIVHSDLVIYIKNIYIYFLNHISLNFCIFIVY